MSVRKLVFLTLAPILACCSFFEFFLAYRHSEQLKDSTNWRVAEAHLTERGDEIKPPEQLGLAPGTFLNLFVSKPYIEYKFKVNDKKYMVRQKLPLCLTFVKAFTIRENVDDSRQDSYDLKDTDLVDQTTGQLKSNLNEFLDEQIEGNMPKVQIKYNPNDPQESLTDPDKLNGTETLFWSGICTLVLAIVAVFAARNPVKP